MKVLSFRVAIQNTGKLNAKTEGWELRQLGVVNIDGKLIEGCGICGVKCSWEEGTV